MALGTFVTDLIHFLVNLISSWGVCIFSLAVAELASRNGAAIWGWLWRDILDWMEFVLFQLILHYDVVIKLTIFVGLSSFVFLIEADLDWSLDIVLILLTPESPFGVLRGHVHITSFFPVVCLHFVRLFKIL